jgi:hypothetical protein
MKVTFAKPETLPADMHRRFIRDLRAALQNNTFAWRNGDLRFPDADPTLCPWSLVSVRNPATKPPDAETTQALITLACMQWPEVMP